jgi:DNA-directed RNA polymerase subunit RPC12/RpoP
MSEMYRCLKCGKINPRSKWEEIEGQFRCPDCGFKIAAKTSPPIVRRVKAL